MTELPCGRDEKCGPCEGLAEPYSSAVCVVVASVVERPDLSAESSLASIRDAVWKKLEEADIPRITHRTQSGAFASAVELLLEQEDS